MGLPNGHYKTEAGSTVEVFGKHSGAFRVKFDWMEESPACFDCEVNHEPEDWGNRIYHLTWHCDYCGGGSAALSNVEKFDA